MKKIFSAVLLTLLVMPGAARQSQPLLGKEQTKEMYDFWDADLISKISSNRMPKKKLLKCEKVTRQFAVDMSIAWYSKNRKEKTVKALDKNVYRMYVILNEKEYRSYLKILNEEMVKRGIDWF
jgi:hypothetical protein